MMGVAPSGEAWVSGCGYLTGTFAQDWLGIPATGRKTNIWFGLFYLVRDGKIAEGFTQLDILSVMRQLAIRYCHHRRAPMAARSPVPGPRMAFS